MASDNHPDDWQDVTPPAAHDDGHPDDWADLPADRPPHHEQGLDETAAVHALSGAGFNNAGRTPAEALGNAADALFAGKGFGGARDAFKATTDKATKDWSDSAAQGAQDNPHVAGLSDVAGMLAHPLNRVIGPIAGAAEKVAAPVAAALGKVPVVGKLLGYGASAAARGVAGGATGYGLGAADALSRGGSLSDANETGKGRAVFNAAAAASPLLTGGAMMAQGLQEEDPYRSTQLMAGGTPLAAAGGVSKFRAAADMLNGPVESAKSGIADTLMKPALRKEQASLKGYQRKLGKDVYPVGGPRAPSEPGAEPSWSDPQAKMAKEIQDSYALARAHKELGLPLDENAQRGLANLTPDYQSRINSELGKYAGGKEARLAELQAILEGRAPQEGAAPRPPPTRTDALPFGLQNGLDQRQSFDLKPDPLAGLDPKAVRARAEQMVPAELEKMRAEKAPGARVLHGVSKAVVNPLSGMLQTGGLITGGLKTAATMAGGAGLYGAGKAMLTDPVVVTALQSSLAKNGARGQQAANFLAGAEGPVLQKKLEFLKQHFPELAHLLGASDGR